jgi:hypothetical protein
MTARHIVSSQKILPPLIDRYVRYWHLADIPLANLHVRI